MLGTKKLFSSSENHVLQALANGKTKECGIKVYININIKLCVNSSHIMLLRSLTAYLKTHYVTNAHPTL